MTFCKTVARYYYLGSSNSQLLRTNYFLGFRSRTTILEVLQRLVRCQSQLVLAQLLLILIAVIKAYHLSSLSYNQLRMLQQIVETTTKN